MKKLNKRAKILLIVVGLIIVGILNLNFGERVELENTKKASFYEDYSHNFKAEAEDIIATYNTNINASKLKHLLIYLNGLCQEYDINYELAKSLIAVESSWRHKVSSSVQAVGLMQIRYAAAKDFDTPHKYMEDPYVNLTVGIKYLKKMLNQFDGDINTALVGYNEGHVYASRYKKEYIDNSRYVEKVEKVLNKSNSLIAMN